MCRQSYVTLIAMEFSSSHKRQEYDKKYHAENREKRLEYHRQWRSDNNDYDKARKRKWRDENSERERERQRAYFRTEKGRLAKRNSDAKRRAAKYGNGESDIDTEWLVSLKKLSTTCGECKVEMVDEAGFSDSKQLDHIVPLNVGGAHVRMNVRFICRTCNLRRPHDGSDIQIWR